MAPQSRNILITGCASGIGLTTALHLSDKGYRIFAGVRREEDADRLRAINPKLEPVQLDVTKARDREAIVHHLEENGGLVALINNAGRNLLQPFEETSLAEMDALMDVNFRSVCALTKACLPLLQQSATREDTAKIINIGSIGSLVGVPWEVFYHASKFAMAGWSEGLGLELYRDNIRVVLICPGGVKTPFIAKSREQSERSSASRHVPDLKKMQALMAQVDRFGSDPEDVAKAIARSLEARNPRPIRLVGWDARMILMMKRSLPQRVFQALSRQVYLAKA
jgi:NAD(P)-dependent dehydrogenase (short-subunit alcohol dehydrogenase family)